jgi:hyperosmotically inducible protein
MIAKTMKRLLYSGLAAAAILCAQAPDNTKTNQQDRDRGAVTSDSQTSGHDDLRLAKEIRQSIVKDKGLSTYAHNVKVIVQNGQVTLKGPVRTEAEKSAVEQKATAVAGENKVVNQLDIAPDKK